MSVSSPPPPAPSDPSAPTAPCPYCGAGNPPDTRYCLECGEGVRPYELVPMPATRRVVGADGATSEIVTERTFPGNLWLGLLALLLIAGALTAFVIAGEDDDTTAAGTNTVQPTDTTGPVETDTTGGVTDTTSTETIPEETTTDGTDTGDGTATGTDDWGGSSGWAVFLKSVPKAQGDQAARDFQSQHSDVADGVLDSDNYSSLRSGWWVVYDGPVGGSSAAKSRAAELRNSGFPDAYARQVSP